MTFDPNTVPKNVQTVHVNLNASQIVALMDAWKVAPDNAKPAIGPDTVFLYPIPGQPEHASNGFSAACKWAWKEGVVTLRKVGGDNFTLAQVYNVKVPASPPDPKDVHRAAVRSVVSETLSEAKAANIPGSMIGFMLNMAVKGVKTAKVSDTDIASINQEEIKGALATLTTTVVKVDAE